MVHVKPTRQVIITKKKSKIQLIAINYIKNVIKIVLNISNFFFFFLIEYLLRRQLKKFLQNVNIMKSQGIHFFLIRLCQIFLFHHIAFI